jgi:hypothetical protein
MKAGLWIISCVCLAFVLAGCSSYGGSSLSGGSVPIGTIDGQVVLPMTRAITLEPAADVPVRLLDTTGQLLQSTSTLQDGTFSFTNVPNGDLVIKAERQDGFAAEVRVAIDNLQRKVSLRITLADQANDPFITPPKEMRLVLQPSGIPLTPNAPLAVYVGQTLQFTAQFRFGENTWKDDVPVSWIVRDGIGTIDGDGLFLAKQAGQGKIIAQYRDWSSTVVVMVIDPSSVVPSSREVRDDQ